MRSKLYSPAIGTGVLLMADREQRAHCERADGRCEKCLRWWPCVSETKADVAEYIELYWSPNRGGVTVTSVGACDYRPFRGWASWVRDKVRSAYRSK